MSPAAISISSGPARRPFADCQPSLDFDSHAVARLGPASLMHRQGVFR
jgi:hypothetical protein